jgi:hypothetical protein
MANKPQPSCNHHTIATAMTSPTRRPMVRRQSALWLDDLMIGVTIGVGLMIGLTGLMIGVSALESSVLM